MGSVTELVQLVNIGKELGLRGPELRSWFERERAELSAIRAAERKAHLDALYEERDKLDELGAQLDEEHAALRKQLSDLQLASTKKKEEEPCCVRDCDARKNIGGDKAAEGSGLVYVPSYEITGVLKDNELSWEKGGTWLNTTAPHCGGTLMPTENVERAAVSSTASEDADTSVTDELSFKENSIDAIETLVSLHGSVPERGVISTTSSACKVYVDHSGIKETSFPNLVEYPFESKCTAPEFDAEVPVRYLKHDPVKVSHNAYSCVDRTVHAMSSVPIQRLAVRTQLMQQEGGDLFSVRKTRKMQAQEFLLCKRERAAESSRIQLIGRRLVVFRGTL